ncbi:MAG TPA: HAMP domain-containing sensor histidine kinase [Spirochaetota bacterium]|nr:HAMP domain-containing sensor histidine kinase [Spirochaetota bacterium]HOM38626.1 HAMP domain-containing sensor histidine kinase [Spirochaetota bacterium]HPQ49763.1 HAMP domain-containing sensor histidine kinase [Spirochaetota bacterium]
MKNTILNKFKIFLIIFFAFIVLFIILILIHTRAFIKKNIKDTYFDTTKHISLFVANSIKDEILSVIKFIDLSKIKEFIKIENRELIKDSIKSFINYKKNIDKNFSIRDISVIKDNRVIYGKLEKEDKILNVPIYFQDYIKRDKESYYISVFINRDNITFKVDLYFLELLKTSEIAVLSDYSLPILSINIFYMDKLIYSSFPYNVGTDLKDFININTSKQVLIENNKRIFISNYQEIFDNTMLYFIIEYDYETVIGYYDKLSFIFISITLIIILIIITISNSFLKNVFVNPLKILKESLENIWENKSIIKLEKYSSKNDEFGILARTFINMLNEIKTNFIKLAESKKILENSNKEKDDFIAVLAHEIKTPLNGILGTAEIILTYYQDSLTKELLESINIIKESATRLLRIINTSLTLSEIEIGEIKIENNIVEIDEIIKYCINLFNSLKYTYNKDKIDFRLEKNSIINYIITDKDKIVQVLNNLINNAIKFTEEGTVSLSIYNDDNKIYFKISDTGIGIPEDKIKNIFKKFYHGQTYLSKSKEGLGLGLYIVKKLIKSMGGDIDVESQVNSGTTFVFHLPLSIGNKDKKYSKKAFVITGNDEIDFKYRFFFETIGFISPSLTESELLEKILYNESDIVLFNICTLSGLKIVENIEKLKKISTNKFITIPIVTLKNNTILVLKNTSFIINDKECINTIKEEIDNYENINKVLILGNEENIYNIKEILLSNGFLVHATESLEDIESVKPDIIIIKLISGNDILYAINYIEKNNPSNIPIIVSIPINDFMAKKECNNVNIKDTLEGYSIGESINIIKTILKDKLKIEV